MKTKLNKSQAKKKRPFCHKTFGEIGTHSAIYFGKFRKFATGRKQRKNAYGTFLLKKGQNYLRMNEKKVI